MYAVLYLSLIFVYFLSYYCCIFMPMWWRILSGRRWWPQFFLMLNNNVRKAVWDITFLWCTGRESTWASAGVAAAAGSLASPAANPTTQERALNVYNFVVPSQFWPSKYFHIGTYPIPTWSEKRVDSGTVLKKIYTMNHNWALKS